jgi:hypothetical protein
MHRLVAGVGWKMDIDAAATARYAAALAPATAGVDDTIDVSASPPSRPKFAKAIVDPWCVSAFDPDGPSVGNVEAIDSLTEKCAKPI